MKTCFKALTAVVAVLMMTAISNKSVAMSAPEAEDSVKRCEVNIPYTTEGKIYTFKEIEAMPWEQRLVALCHLVWKNPRIPQSCVLSVNPECYKVGIKRGELVYFAYIFKKGTRTSVKICGVSATKKDLDAGIFVVSKVAKGNSMLCEWEGRDTNPANQPLVFKYKMKVVD